MIITNVIGKGFFRAVSVRSFTYDVGIIGGGIIGLAAAQELIVRHPKLKFVLFEKESDLSTHQSGHNSGVIHAGLYYKPGSLMAKLCLEGLESTYKYCDRFGIPYRKCGKLVVATDDLEVSRLEDLYKRALQNGVPDLEYLNSEAEIRKIEPHCRGLKAIRSPHTGIVDWAEVARCYARSFRHNGGKIRLNFGVVSIKSRKDHIEVRSQENESVYVSNLLTCAGLYSDRVAEMTNCSSEPKIIPFRGEYLLLNRKKSGLVRGNIYPVPDPRFPFLGVHFTPRMNGEIWLGPNAVLAFKREGYKRTDLSLADLAEVLKYPGFRKLVKKYIRYGSSEAIRSVFISLVVKELRKYIPEISRRDISRGPSGVRAQAMNTQGNLVADFVFDEEMDNILHCRNAPSPGATSSLPIGRMMADKVEVKFGLPRNGNAVLY